MAENDKNGMDAKKGNLWTSNACKVPIESSGPKD